VLPDFWQTEHSRGLVVDGHSLIQDEPKRVFDLPDEDWPHEPPAKLHQERFEGHVVDAWQVEAGVLSLDDAAPNGDADRPELVDAFVQPKLFVEASRQGSTDLPHKTFQS
jgi:hypothetical protein